MTHKWTRSSSLLVPIGLSLTLLVSACSPPPTPETPVARQAQAIPVNAALVERGDIDQSLAYSGDIRSVGQINILAKGTGRLERLFVDVGSHVRAGDTIAELERESASYQVVQARAGVAAAEAKLAQLQAGGKAEDIAAAQAALRQQEARLASMRAGGRADDVAVAQAALDAQMARLDQLERGGRNEAIAQAQAGVDGARAKLATVRRGATDDVRQAARSSVDSSRAAVTSAEASLASAEAGLAAVEETIASDIKGAQSAHAASTAAVSAAQAAINQSHNPPPADLAAAQAAVAKAEADLDAARNALAQSQLTPAAGSRGVPPLPPSNNSSFANVAAASQALNAARAQLEQVRRGGTAANRAQLDAALEEAQAQEATTRARLDALTASGANAQRSAAQSQRSSAQSQLTAAREKLRSDEARLEEVLAGPHEDEVAQAQAAVEQAEQQLALAIAPTTDEEVRAQRALVEEARLQIAKAALPYTSYDIQQQEQAVAQARAGLDAARNPFSREEIAAAQAAVAEARASLALADLGIQETTVTAPVDGTVSERLVAQGALVSPSTPLVTLVPPDLELVVNVEEAQLGQVSEGQPVTLQVVAYPGQTFSGNVVAVSPTVDTRTRTSSVRVVPKDDDGQLRAGMLARLSILTASRMGVLLVPREAIAVGTSPTAVVVDDNTRARRVPVQLGLSNDRLVEVVSGLTEGQLVVTRGSADLADGDLLDVQPGAQTRTAQIR